MICRVCLTLVDVSTCVCTAERNELSVCGAIFVHAESQAAYGAQLLRAELFNQKKFNPWANFWGLVVKMVRRSKSMSYHIAKLCHYLMLLHELV